VPFCFGSSYSVIFVTLETLITGLPCGDPGEPLHKFSISHIGVVSTAFVVGSVDYREYSLKMLAFNVSSCTSSGMSERLILGMQMVI
jgi:hypothetical protein